MLRTAIKFGLFLAVCIVFTMYLALTIGNRRLGDLNPFAGSRTYTLSATFDDVTGLLINDNVKIAGVVVGKVTSVKVVDGRARVDFQVRNGYDLPSDTSAGIRWRNLIGQRYVYLYPGTKSTTMLEDGDVITDTTSVVDLGELFNRLGPIVSALDPRQVNDFLDTITQALDGNQDKVSQAVDDLATLAKGLGERDEAIGRLVTNLNTVAGTLTNRDAQIRTMLDNLVLISQAFSDNTDIVDESLTEFASFSANLSALLGNNRTELDRIIANLDLVVQTVGSKLPQLDSALSGLDLTAKVIYRSSALGEWLNETILCSSATAPVGDACQQSLVKGASTPSSASTASSSTSTPVTAGADAISQLVSGGLS